MRTISQIAFFLSIVWRPVTGEAGDTWLQSWWKHRLDAVTAWKLAKLAYPTTNTPQAMNKSKWSVYRNHWWSQPSAWPRWYAGISNGQYGIGVVRESWGWRIMLGPWDFCRFTGK